MWGRGAPGRLAGLPALASWVMRGAVGEGQLGRGWDSTQIDLEN
jgi:hypothetical protein